MVKKSSSVNTLLLLVTCSSSVLPLPHGASCHLVARVLSAKRLQRPRRDELVFHSELKPNLHSFSIMTVTVFSNVTGGKPYSVYVISKVAIDQWNRAVVIKLLLDKYNRIDYNNSINNNLPTEGEAFFQTGGISNFKLRHFWCAISSLLASSSNLIGA